MGIPIAMARALPDLADAQSAISHEVLLLTSTYHKYTASSSNLPTVQGQSSKTCDAFLNVSPLTFCGEAHLKKIDGIVS